VWALGRPSFLTHRLLAGLAAEAAAQQPPLDPATRRGIGPPGRVLAGLAVSRQLREAVAAAVGAPAKSTHRAVYQYESGGSHVRAHLDTADYPLVVHLMVAGATSSALVVGDVRVPLAVGEAVVLRGASVRHAWEPLAPSDTRTLTAIGFSTPFSTSRGVVENGDGR
jgi:hypothetical protein